MSDKIFLDFVVNLNVVLQGNGILSRKGPVSAEVVHRDGVDPLTKQIFRHRVWKDVALKELEEIVVKLLRLFYLH